MRQLEVVHSIIFYLDQLTTSQGFHLVTHLLINHINIREYVNLCVSLCRRLEQALEEGDAFIQTLAEAVEPSPGHKHVGGQASFKRAERHMAVRIAMVELQEAFNCVKSASHVTTAVGGGPEERFDYMSSLFKHVDALATLLLKWKSVGVYKSRSFT